MKRLIFIAGGIALSGAAIASSTGQPFFIWFGLGFIGAILVIVGIVSTEN